MKHRYLIPALFATLALAGCSTETVVTLQDGSQYVTKSMPKTKTADGLYEFTDVAGKQVRVRSDQIATVKEED